MGLADFIRGNQSAIVAEWEAFAATQLPAAGGMTRAALRDHATEILTALATDMDEPQGGHEQAEKSKGRGARHALKAVGGIHAALRLQNGFDICQLIAEYRALRASILRLWDKSGGCTLSEVTRFNEAVDEAMMEATVEYSATIEETRDQFLGVLGHDLRNPLAGIMMWAASIKRSATQAAHTNAATRVINSAGRMERMVNDLLDLTRTRLGAGIPIVPQPTDLAPLLQEVLDELAAGKQHNITVDAEGDLQGDWDRDRLAQVISNLIGNAVQHGSPGTPVHVRAWGTAKDVTIEVHNSGPAISPAALPTVFEPMVRHAQQGHSTSLGLGLYIAREIVTSHGGTIRVTSTADEGTTFRVCLPRVPKTALIDRDTAETPARAP